MTSIDITMRKGFDPTSGQSYYEVQIGPDNHVCTEVRRFWIPLDEDNAFETADEVWSMAHGYKRGAAAALQVASGLTARFLRNGSVVHATQGEDQ